MVHNNQTSCLFVLSYSHIIINVDGCNPDMSEGQLWPETAPGSTAVGTRCPCTEAEGQLAARVIRKCVGTYGDGARWGPVDNSQCGDRLSGQLCMLFQVSIYPVLL